MADFHIRVTVDSTGGRVRVPAGATYAKPGSFASGGTPEFRRALRDINRRRAKELQADVVDNVRRGIQRRTVSSGRLAAVTGDPRNATWDDFGYGVGDIDFLDRSIAKYWRQIEQGYEGHVGRTIHGFWGGSITRISGDRVYAGAPWYRHGSRRSDMFIPATGFREQGRFAKFGANDDEETAARSVPNFARTTTIKNPIEAHYDYRDAKRSFEPGRRGVEDVTDLLRVFSEKAWQGQAARAGRFWTR